MGRRAVALNTSLIHINNMSAYYNTNHIFSNNNIDITGNTNISHNLTISGTDNINHNYNIISNAIIYNINITNKKIVDESNNEYTIFNLYIGNTYIFDQTTNNTDLLILSKKEVKYNRTSGIRERTPYNKGVLYYEENWSSSDTANRTKLKFTPTERGVYYIVSKNINTQIKTVRVNVLDNVYKYGSFITNSGMGLTKNLNIGGNMNVKNGMLYAVNDPQYIQQKCVGINTTIPRLGLDMTNLPNYNDAILLPKTIGVATTIGIDGMIRFESNLNIVQGYLENEYIAIGLVQDKDKDTLIDAEIPDRLNHLEFTTNAHKRLTILDTDLTLIGIATTLPKATLEINGNLNITNDNTTSGVDFCNDLTHTDNYLHINLTNTSDKGNKSFDLLANNGGLTKKISNNLIETINSNTKKLNNSKLDISNTYTKTFTDNNTFTLDSSNTITISKNLNKTIENTLIETYNANNKTIIKDNSIETYLSTFDTSISNNLIYNVNTTKFLNVKNDVTEIYKNNYNININSDLITTINGINTYTLNNINFETYNNNKNSSIFGTKNVTINNNSNKSIKQDYNINIGNNTNETYYNNFNKHTELAYNLNVNSNYKTTSNNNIINYNRNVDLTHNNSFNNTISLNKNININNNLSETVISDIYNTINKNNSQTIKNNYDLHLKNTTNTNINGNININLEKNYNAFEVEIHKRFIGSTDNNIFYNTNINSNFICNLNNLNNLVVYDSKNKYINLNSVEIYNKNKFDYLHLFGHELSAPNTISYEIPPIYTTNYIYIVLKSLYETKISTNRNYYVFPGYDYVNNVNIVPSTRGIDDWFIFEPSTSTPNTYNIINSADTGIGTSNSGTGVGINSGVSANEFYVIGPNVDNCYNIILKQNYDSSNVYSYDYKFIIGPRYHQLEYNLTTHYIKIFNIGNTNNCVKLLRLNNISSTIIIDYDTDINNISDSRLVDDNENKRFTFIYIENTREIINNVSIKAKYYIYSHAEDSKDSSLVGYLYRDANDTLSINSRNDTNNIPNYNADSRYVWTIESVNQDDASFKKDLYYIYNETTTNKYYIYAADSNNTILLKVSPNDLNLFNYQFTFYYYNIYNNYQIYENQQINYGSSGIGSNSNMFFTNIPSPYLKYNEETRAHYLTKDYKHIYINGNTNKFIMSTLNAGSNEVGNTLNNKGVFLLIYNNTSTIPGSGYDIGNFKIYEVNTKKYLFDNKNLDWIIESIEENNNSHDEAIYTIKPYNNGHPTKFLYCNDINNKLDTKDIKFPILTTDNVKFTIINTLTGIQPGTYEKEIHDNYIKHITQTEDLMIVGNNNEVYNSNYNINISENLNIAIKNKYNLNITQDVNKTFSKNNQIVTNNNVHETILLNKHLFVEQNSNTIYKNDYSINNLNGISIVMPTFNKDIDDTSNTFILNTDNEQYNKDYTIKSSNNSVYIDIDLEHYIYNTNTSYINESATIVNNSNKTVVITNNFNKSISLEHNINITQNNNIFVNSNVNTNITNDLNISVSNNKNTHINKFNYIKIDKNTTLDYHKNLNTTLNNNYKSNINGLVETNITNITNETYKNNKTSIINGNLGETVKGYMNLNVTKDLIINDTTDFNLSCMKNINLNSNGYVNIVNDISNSGYPTPSDKKALVVNGGSYIKKDLFIGGDVLINQNLNVLSLDVSTFKTEDVEIHDPLILIGLSQTNDSTYSGILARTYVNSLSKFTGLVRDENSEYALLNNINTDTNDTTEYSTTDMDTTYNTLPVDKHANFTGNQIISVEPNINAYGDMYIAKNIFLGIALDTVPQATLNNSFTINVGSNINTTNNNFNITTNKNILYNITSGSNIDINSGNNYIYDIKNNRNIKITNNKLETVNKTYTKIVNNITNLTYNNHYNINTTGNLIETIGNNYDKSIHSNYYINHSDSLSHTVKYNYNLNIVKNNTIDIHSNNTLYTNNYNTNINKSSTIHINNDKNIDINGNYKCNINGTNTIYVKLASNETYKSKDINIKNNLTKHILGNNEKYINSNSTLNVTNFVSETYGNTKTTSINNNYNINITNNNDLTVNNNLIKSITNNVNETYKKNNSITISENLNKTISGSYNLNITNNSKNLINDTNTNIIYGNTYTTYNNKYNINVTDESYETYYGYNKTISNNYNKNIQDNKNLNIVNDLTLLIKHNSNFTTNNNYTSIINNNLTVKYNGNYDKYVKKSVIESYLSNKDSNIKSNYDYNVNKSYTQHTGNISSNTLYSNYDYNLDGTLTETLYSNLGNYKNKNKNITINNNTDNYINQNKTITIQKDLVNTILSNINTTTQQSNTENYSENDITIDYNKTQTIHNSYLLHITGVVDITNKKDYINNIHNNLEQTFDKTYYTKQINNLPATNITNTEYFNSSVTKAINNNYTKNVYLNNEAFMKINLNKTVVGSTSVTYKQDNTIHIDYNKSQIINSNFIQNISKNVTNIYKGNLSTTISQNNNITINDHMNSTIYDNLIETYNASKTSKTGTNDLNTYKYNNVGYVNTNITGTYENTINGNNVETYNMNYNNNITGINTVLVNGTLKNTINGNNVETYNSSSTIIHFANTTTVKQKYNKYIHSNTFETKGASTIKTTGYTKKHITGTYNITSNHTSTPNINITTLGNLNITADANIYKNNNINFMTRVGIKSSVSYTPQIITTTMIYNDDSLNISKYINSSNSYTINPSTVNIISINTHTSLNNLANENIYIRLTLQDGAYNGQIIKILLHPKFESTFDINNRLSNNLKTNVIIRVNSFCDANTNEYEIVDLILNKGGMGLSLIYVDNNTVNESYWMLMNNNFIQE